MMKSWILTSLLVVCSFSLVHAMEIENKAKEKIENSKESSYFTLNIENDFLGENGTDRHYTSGVRIGYTNLKWTPPEFFEYIFPTDFNETTTTSFSIGQNLYTPRDISSRSLDSNDRPWAGFLYGSLGFSTFEDNHLDEYELTVGIVGPSAYGEETQKWVHKQIESTEPKGWDNQLDDEVGVMMSWNRRWPQKFMMDVGPLAIGFSPHAGLTVGNIYTYANTGLTLKLGADESIWSDYPLSVRPSLPGKGYFITEEEDDFSWFVFAGVEGRAVAWNIFLDGNMDGNSHSVDKEPLVADANAGVAIRYKDIQLSYTTVYRTKEFEGQINEDVFGAINLSFRF